MTDKFTLTELISYHLGSNKDVEFNLFGSDVYTSDDKIRILLVVYCGLAVRKLPLMSRD